MKDGKKKKKETQKLKMREGESFKIERDKEK